jgi:hypothetical protein
MVSAAVLLGAYNTRGLQKVLYAPNNTAADTIIVKVNISISVIHECYMLLIILLILTFTIMVSAVVLLGAYNTRGLQIYLY